MSLFSDNVTLVYLPKVTKSGQKLIFRREEGSLEGEMTSEDMKSARFMAPFVIVPIFVASLFIWQTVRTVSLNCERFDNQPVPICELNRVDLFFLETKKRFDDDAFAFVERAVQIEGEDSCSEDLILADGTEVSIVERCGEFANNFNRYMNAPEAKNFEYKKVFSWSSAFFLLIPILFTFFFVRSSISQLTGYKVASVIFDKAEKTVTIYQYRLFGKRQLVRDFSALGRARAEKYTYGYDDDYEGYKVTFSKLRDDPQAAFSLEFYTLERAQKIANGLNKVLNKREA